MDRSEDLGQGVEKKVTSRERRARERAEHDALDRFGQRAREDEWGAETPGTRDEEGDGVNYRERVKHEEEQDRAK